MVDYKAIADADPGGDLEAAFDTLRDMTETRQRTGVYQITMTLIAKELGRDAARRIYAGVKTAVDVGAMDDWELAELNAEGFDINDPETVTAINSLAENNLLTQSDANRLLALRFVTALKYPDIKLGHLETARIMRAAGEI